MTSQTTKRVAIAGLGTIGRPVAAALAKGVIPGMALGAVSARDQEKARATLSDMGTDAPVVSLEALVDHADVIIECAPRAVFEQIATPAIEAGRILMPLSVGALLDNMHLVDRARETGGRIVVPSGAIVCLDALKGAAEGTIHSVSMETRKPPLGLASAPYLRENNISVDGLVEPLRVFSGPAREAARHFPANINVAVAISLAGIGPDRTMVEIWADPTVERNQHTIRVDADSTRFTCVIEGVPSPENPATGKLTPLSVLASLRGLVTPLLVGT